MGRDGGWGNCLPRLFISHSSNDNIHALAFQRWLELKGWSTDDLFIDQHDMRAGEKWRETLVKANVACQALLYLASPESLNSDECRREVRRAEDDRKDVIVAILRNVTVDDPRLAGYTDRQIMDLSTNPREERVEVEHNGQRHLIDFNRAALAAIHAKLIDWGIAPDAFAWPPRHNPKAPPYPGLDAFDEHSTGIFFGREADVMAGIRDLRQIRHRGSPRLLVIQAASGAGKSSFLRAGLWPRLGRTSEFVPLAVVPAAVLAIFPYYRDYRYVVEEDTVCIVDPETYEIVDILDEGTYAPGPRPQVAELTLTDRERVLVLDSIPPDFPQAQLRIRLALGAEIPPSIELYEFAPLLLDQVPKLRDFRFVVTQAQLVIVEPQDRSLALVLDR